MTREIKLSLLLGFGLVLAVGLLISDHLSKASTHPVSGYPVAESASVPAPEPGFGRSTLGVSDAAGTAVAGGRDLVQMVLDGPELHPVAQVESLPQEAGRRDPSLPAQGDGPVILRMGQATSGDSEADGSVPRVGVVHSLHRVQRNENLWKIAEKYYGTGAAYPQLAAFNRDRVFGESDVAVGTTLIIPSYEQLMQGPEPAVVEQRRSQPKTAPRARTHTVADGETLSEISAKYFGTVRRWQDILELNRDQLKTDRDLRSGMTIRIPTS